METSKSQASNKNNAWAMPLHHPPASNYAINGKIMLTSVIVLFVAVILILCFHSYARWFFHRQNRRRRRRLLALRNTAAAASAPSQALDPSVLKTIPIFVYSSEKDSGEKTQLECAVCLSEFEDDEEGRVLPKCGHVFHVECIDTWFRSRSNCPLCRAPVQPVNPVTRQEQNQASVTATEPAGSVCGSGHLTEDIETGRSSSSSSLPSSSTSSSLSSPSSSSSSSARFPPESSVRQPLDLVGIIVEMPSGPGSKPPGHGVLSLKRIWSI